ncbi:MAG: hypothetical protein ABIN97_18540 [Ginsengibacter sp.]
MKKIIILLTLTFTTFQLFSQSDTTKVEQYCEVVATPRSFSNKVTIDINYGEERSLWRDNRLKNDEGKLKKFNSVVDALNYMGKDGWLFVNAFPGTVPNEKIYHYVFKKTFLISQIAE